MLEFARRGTGIDPQSLIRRVLIEGEVPPDVVSSYVSALAELGALLPEESCPGPEIRDFAIRSRLLDLGRNIAAAATAEDGPSGADLIEMFDQDLYDLYLQSNPEPSGTIFTRPQIQRLLDDVDESPTSIGTSFSVLGMEQLRPHILPGRLVVIQEDVDRGGLAMVGRLFADDAIRHTCVFSLGQTAQSVIHRMFGWSVQPEVSSTEVSGSVAEATKVDPQNRTEATTPSVAVDDRFPLSFSELRQRCRWRKRRHTVDMFVIVEPSLLTGSGREMRIQSDRALRDLKRLAGEVHAAIIVFEAGTFGAEMTDAAAVDLFLDMTEPD